MESDGGTAPGTTWWANHNSEVKHAVRDLRAIAVCGAVLHRRARQVGTNSYPARPCKRCTPHLSDEELATLLGHVSWTDSTLSPAAANRKWQIEDST